MKNKRQKILYAASTASHLRRFHMPYIHALREENDVFLMATEGEGIDFPISFSKRMFSFGNLRALWQIRSVLKRERFDRILVHTSLAAFLIRLAAFGLRHRPYLVNVVHGYLFSYPPRGKKDRLLLFCEKLVRRKTDALAVMNREDERIAEKEKLALRPPVFLYGMGMPKTEMLVANASLRAQFAACDDLLCCFVGELSKRKNQIFLIRATHMLREAGIPVRLMLLGEGGERETLEREISSLGLSDSVFLCGNREPVQPYLAAADLYVSASHSEGLPFNVMEAMALGLPILASDTKGQTDLLENTPEALYPAGDSEAFCKAVTRIFQSDIRGVGSIHYSALQAYRLENVFATNLKFLTEEKRHDADR